MEQLCISSFQRHGHPFHLYVYQDTQGIPPGTILLDANEILPASRIFMYRSHASYAGFANFFRYKLLLEKGGWWVDTDTVCVKPFEFPEPFVFSSELPPHDEASQGLTEMGVTKVNAGVFKSPAGSAVMQFCWDFCARLDPSELVWGQCGPLLVARAVQKYSLRQYVHPPEVFCPVPYREWQKQLEPDFSWSFGPETFAIHLWNEMWRRANVDKDAPWPPGCLYEQLKAIYLTNTKSAANPWTPSTPHAAEIARDIPQGTPRPSVSVIVPTCNPRLDLLHWTLQSLARQTMLPSDFEVVVVDNNSGFPLQKATLAWAGKADLRIVREPRPGLVYARIAGLNAARADLLVFADDDNALDDDYLEQALRIARADPHIGCFGGIARPVLEAPAPAWKKPLLGYLGTRHYGAAPVTSTKNQWGEWEPIGAGMVCRRTVAEEFAAWVERSPLAARLGRTEGAPQRSRWLSGEDTLMALASYKLGYACSYQPALKLSHWIRKDRLRLATLARILMGHGRSFVILQHLKGHGVQRLSARQAFHELFRLHRIRADWHGFLAGTLVWFRDLGFQLEARRLGPQKVQLGSGWYPLESFQGEQFRWVNNDAMLFVGPRGSNEEPLQLEVAPGPGLAGAPLTIRVLDRRGRRIQTAEIQARGILNLHLPASHVEASYRLRVEGGGKKIPSDSRILNFRVFKIGTGQSSALDIIGVCLNPAAAAPADQTSPSHWADSKR